MPVGLLDPDRPRSDPQRFWWRRSPDDPDRPDLVARQYPAGLGPSYRLDPDPAFRLQIGSAGDVDPQFSRGLARPTKEVDPGFSWRGGAPGAPTALPGAATLRPFLPAADGDSDLVRDFRAPPAPQPSLLRPARGPLLRTSQDAPPQQRPPRPDPARTDVFRPGPDGKLHPVAGWRTTGPFDFDTWSHNVDWDGVRRDLSNIVVDSLLFMDGGLGADAKGLDAILGRGAKGFIDRHHPDPRFMGGRDDQETVELVQSLHRKFHGRLRAGLKGQDVPPVGGPNGSARDWDEFFEKYPEAREWAVKNLQRVTRDFDVEHGTSIERFLEKELRIVRPKAPPPTK